MLLCLSDKVLKLLALVLHLEEESQLYSEPKVSSVYSTILPVHLSNDVRICFQLLVEEEELVVEVQEDGPQVNIFIIDLVIE